MNFVEDVVTRLVSQGVLTNADWVEGPRARIPAGAGPYGQISLSGGTQDVIQHDSSYPRPSAQIMLIGEDAAATKAMAETARRILHCYNLTINGSFYAQIVPAQSVFPFGTDGLNRSQFVFNIDALVTAVAP